MAEDVKKQEDARAVEYGKKKKLKKDPKKKTTEKPQVFVDEEQYPNRVYWNFQSPPISFEFRAVFQGEPYPNPVRLAQKEEEAKEAKGKEAKGKKKDAKEEPEMLIPDPITIAAESNRKFQIKMSTLIR